jgi:hypothetical protein
MLGEYPSKLDVDTGQVYECDYGNLSLQVQRPMGVR